MGLTVWSGLTQGAIFALVGAGFVLSLLPSGALNFAQGALVVGGSYLTYLWLHALGMPPVAALVGNVLVGGIVGVVCEVVTIRPLRAGGLTLPAGSPAELITTVGMAQLLSGVYGNVFDELPLAVPFIGPTEPVPLAGIGVLPVQIVSIVLAAVVCVGLHLLFRSTRAGKACRAISEDREAAALRGINVNLFSIMGFAAAGALAGVAAMAIGPVTFALPTLANSLALGGFVALAIGGESSFLGVLLGGALIGILSSIASRYLGSEYFNIAILVTLLVTLLVRPGGLGSRGVARSV